MSNFNFDAFRPVRSADIERKQVELAQASADKKAALAAKQAPQDTSWSGQLGLDGGSFLSNRVNDVASLVSGGSRLAGDILSLPANTFASLTSNPSDAAYLRSQAKDVRNTFDLSNIVEQTNRNELNTALGDGFENEWNKVKSGWKDGKPSQVVAGIAGLLMNAGEAVVTNPSATREYIIENAPQLLLGEFGAVGKAGMLASNVGYAADNYRTGLEEYAKQHNGAMPPENERTRMALLSASLAAAEHGGDMFQHAVGGLGKIAKATEGVAGAAEAGAQATKAGLLQSLKRTAIAAAEGGAEETATEGYQTWAEGEINQKPASALDIFQGAVVGGVAGAGLSGGLHGTAEALQATPEHVAERAQAETQAATEQAKVQQAVADKAPETFLDTNSPDYSPAKAVAVLHEMSKQDGVQPEQVQEHLQKSGEVISQLEERKQQIEQKQANAPERIKVLKEEITNTESLLNDPDATPDDHAMFGDHLKAMRTELEGLTGKEAVLARQNRLSEVTRQLADAREVHHDLVRLANPTPSQTEVDTHLEAANSTDTKVASKAGDVLLNLSMTAPDSIDPSAIKNLVNNTENGLSTEQRDVLRKFSEARTAENEVKKQSDVSQEVLFGQKKPNGNIGIEQYRTRIGAAVASGNQQSAERNLSLLGAFADSHMEKLRAIAKADVGDQIVKQDGKWQVNTGKRLNDKQRAENGAVNVHENSGKLIKEIQNEAKALRAAHASLSAAVALRFGNAVVQSAHPTAQPTSQNISSKKTGEGKTRLNDKPVQTVVKPTQISQEVKSKAENISADTSTTTPNSIPRVQVGPKADGFSNINAQAARDQSDTLGLTKQIEDQFAQGKTATQVRLALKDQMKVIPQDEHASFIVQVRATLGIPSQDTVEGKREFQAWKQEYDQRNSPAASPQSQPSGPIAADAAQATVAQSATATSTDNASKQDAGVVPSSNSSPKESNVDTGEGIPKSYWNTPVAHKDVWVSDEKRFDHDGQPKPAHKVLKAIRDEIAKLEALASCMKG
jgi:hypothetical protein